MAGPSCVSRPQIRVVGRDDRLSLERRFISLDLRARIGLHFARSLAMRRRLLEHGVQSCQRVLMSHMARQNSYRPEASENRRPSPDLPGTSGLMQQAFSAMKIQLLSA